MIFALFWSAVGLAAYAYLLFPLLVLARGLLWPRPFRPAGVTPRVSIVIAAHDEAATIGAKVENLLGLDYPRDRLEIVIASDGSEDATDEIVRRYERAGGCPQVRLLSLPRQGKAAALAAAVAASTGEVIVFSDANSMYATDAARALVRPLADPAVGGVAGDQRYLAGGETDGIAAGERGYWSFDRLLKRAESRGGSVISATGAIYAIRRSLFQAVPPDVTDDFFISTGVIAQGRRLVFTPDAVAYEPVAPSAGIEFGRKVRVITRGLRGVLARRGLLNPVRHRFYALQLLSHKVLRRLTVFPLLVLLVTAPLLWGRGPLYQAATLGQTALYGAGIAGVLLSGTALGRSKPFAVAAFFCLVNAACLQATWNLVRGRRIERWQPERPQPGAGAPLAADPTKPAGDDVR